MTTANNETLTDKDAIKALNETRASIEVGLKARNEKDNALTNHSKIALDDCLEQLRAAEQARQKDEIEEKEYEKRKRDILSVLETIRKCNGVMNANDMARARDEIRKEIEQAQQEEKEAQAQTSDPNKKSTLNKMAAFAWRWKFTLLIAAFFLAPVLIHFVAPFVVALAGLIVAGWAAYTAIAFTLPAIAAVASALAAGFLAFLGIKWASHSRKEKHINERVAQWSAEQQAAAEQSIINRSEKITKQEQEKSLKNLETEVKEAEKALQSAEKEVADNKQELDIALKNYQEAGNKLDKYINTLPVEKLSEKSSDKLVNHFVQTYKESQRLSAELNETNTELEKLQSVKKTLEANSSSAPPSVENQISTLEKQKRDITLNKIDLDSKMGPLQTQLSTTENPTEHISNINRLQRDKDIAYSFHTIAEKGYDQSSSNLTKAQSALEAKQKTVSTLKTNYAKASMRPIKNTTPATSSSNKGLLEQIKIAEANPDGEGQKFNR